MKKIYLKPVLKISRLKVLPLQGQYQFVITSACPSYESISNTILFEFNENAFNLCAPNCDAPPVSVPSAIVTCANIDGAFTVQLSTPSAGGGLACNSGDVSCTIPVSVNPSLPSDCILDSLTLTNQGQEFDVCESTIG